MLSLIRHTLFIFHIKTPISPRYQTDYKITRILVIPFFPQKQIDIIKQIIIWSTAPFYDHKTALIHDHPLPFVTIKPTRVGFDEDRAYSLKQMAQPHSKGGLLGLVILRAKLNPPHAHQGRRTLR